MAQVRSGTSPPFRFHYSRLWPFLPWGTNNKELAMPTSSSPYPKVLVPSFPLFTNYLWTVVLFFVQCFILRHPSLLLLPAPDVHHCLPCPYSPSPRYSSWGKGAGAQQAGLPITPVPGKVGSAPRMLQQSVGGGAHIDHEGYRDHLFPLLGMGWPFVPAWGFPPVSYLQLLE
jgi:hypothetical protein